MVASKTNFGLLPSGCVQLSHGYTAEYVETGCGEPLVLVPGLAGGIGLLEPLIEELSRFYTVIAYQLRGERQGLFDRSFGFGRLVADLGEVINTLGLERPGVVGVSFGGAIALDYATQNSQKLQFLVLQGVDMTYRPGLYGNVARAVLSKLPLPIDNPFINQFFSVLIGSERSHGDRFDFIVDRCWRTDQSVMVHRMDLLDGYHIGDRLWDVRTPTLVLGGEHDVLVPSAVAHTLSRQMPQAQYCQLTGAGHLAFVTHPGELTRQIRRFDRARGAG